MAGSVTQSKSKGKKAEPSNDKDIVVDRISNLPDSLLCHILSFLPTKEAVGTSILSNRWKPLWTLVPKLDHDEVNIRYKPLKSTHIVYKILALHIAPFLRNFSLRITCAPPDIFHVETWIHTAIACNLQQLQLEIILIPRFYTEKRFRFPHRFFSCKTLVVLELREGIEIDLPSSFEFPSLKILCLIRLCYSDDDCFSRLISGCPVLEDLSFEKDDRDGISISKFKICVPTLKRLRMKFRTYDVPLLDYELVIEAPALDYFEFQGDLRNFNFLKEVTKLIEAHVDISAFDCHDDWIIGYEIDYGDRVFRLVKELHNAKFLSLSPGEKECIDFGSIYPSIFKNLVRLNFGLERCNWHVLQALLQVAPNLEVLVVKKSYNGENKLGWMEPLHGPTPSYTPGYLLSHLTTFNFHQFEGSDREVEFVKYILKEARVLKTLTKKVLSRNYQCSPGTQQHVYLLLSEAYILNWYFFLWMS